jgi:hypothetical protein
MVRREAAQDEREEQSAKQQRLYDREGSEMEGNDLQGESDHVAGDAG